MLLMADWISWRCFTIQLADVVRPVGGALPTRGGGSGSVSWGGSGSGRTSPGGMSTIAERARVWRTRRGEGFAVRDRIGENRSCLTLVPVEGAIDSYPLYRAAYNASCTCCGYGRWHCVSASYSCTTRAGSLEPGEVVECWVRCGW